ncbi:MAG: arsenite/tail-anchored protein-transporting ATPase [Frankiales bacterium]|nr:arsenite/tail-anchored protein-transporting ATPase [Frankiales bacterium]
MRVLLFTGKGGVGKTTVSAATAAVAAARGLKTLVISTDPAHSLADALGVAAGPEPTQVDTGLYVQQVDAQLRFEQSWREVQSWLLSVLDAAGVDPIAAEELTVLPGAEEVLALLEMRHQMAAGIWDLVIVDCAPTAETLRLLALPEAFGWYVERVFPVERRVVRALRPALSRWTKVPMPQDHVFDAVTRLHGELAEVRSVLSDPMRASVRLVLTPESVVVAEARRTLTSLSLYGYRVDGVVANRVFPAAEGDAWRAGWVKAQAEQLAEIRSSFDPLPLRLAPYLAAEPVGLEALTAFGAELYGDSDPFSTPTGPDLLEVERTGDGYVLSIALPLADRREVDLARHGDELLLTVGGRRRSLALPSALRRCTVEGAALRDGRLRVRFEPDPDQWTHR